MDAELFGVRISTGNKVSVKASREGDLYIAQNLPPYALATAAGRGWQAQATSAVAGTTTIPTTTALGTLYNGYAGGGKSLVIDRIFANTEAYDAGKNFFFMWVCIHQLAVTAVSADITIHGLRGGDVTYGGSARFGIGDTVVNDGWHSYGNSQESNEGNAQGMSNIDVPIEGKIVIPPTSAVSLHVGVNDSNFTVQVGVSWYDVQLDLA